MEKKRDNSGSGPIPIPYASRIEDGYLLWDQTAPKYVPAKPSLLEDFLGIRSDAEIGEFSRRWGVLGLCAEHSRPNCDHGQCAPFSLQSLWREPLDSWHRIVRHANAMRRIGENIRLLGSGEKEDWLQIIEETAPPREQGAAGSAPGREWMQRLGQPWRNKRAARERFQWKMQEWMDIGDVRPMFGWDKDRWGIRGAVPSSGEWPLFGYIVLYLASFIAGGAQSQMCYFCGREYWPQRRPSPGQLNCCGDTSCRQAYWRENKRNNKKG